MATIENYLQNPRGNPLLPGALGLGQATATTIQSAFLFFRYLTPIPFAVVSDAYLGRHTTMHISLGYVILLQAKLSSDLTTYIPGCLSLGILSSLRHLSLARWIRALDSLAWWSP